MPVPIGVFVEVTRPFMMGGEACRVGEKLELTRSEARRLLARDRIKLDPDARVEEDENEDEAEPTPARRGKAGR